MTRRIVRTADRTDVPRLVAMNHAAYPELLADGIVFDAAQLAAHQAVFPSGQVVVEDEGIVVGAIATLIVSSERALGEHSWVDITSHGTFAAHDPSGDALYLADVYSDPTQRGRGVGATLYEALFDLCRRKHLARVVAGGRLWGYHAVADRMTPNAYVAEVLSGERRDRVLTPQLRSGFSVLGVLTRYLDDWRSHDYASHLVWANEASVARAPAKTLSAALRN
jgi:GNAT superfamily N-acetyltransferase